jgi:hypothetical protein
VSDQDAQGKRDQTQRSLHLFYLLVATRQQFARVAV